MTRRTLLLATFALVASCGGVDRSTYTTSSPPTAVVDHQVQLADHETPDLAAHLVTVPGYSYVDLPSAERDSTIARLHEREQEMGQSDFFLAMAWHGVVAADASQNRSRTAAGGSEVGLLALFEFRYAPPAGADDDATFMRFMAGANAGLTRHEIAGLPTYRYETPDRPDSAFTYLWLRHGVMGILDGADAGALERWLNVYLAVPVLSPGETARLSERLVPVEGFAYVNAPELTALAGVATKAFGDTPRSIHRIANTDRAIGALVLVQSSAPVTTADAFRRWGDALGDPGTATPREIAGITVWISTDADGYITAVWTDGGIVGCFGSDQAADTDSFLTGLLGAWAAVDGRASSTTAA